MGAAALAAALAAGAQAQAPAVGKPGRAAITSADHRFMVSGLTSAENMALAGQLAGQAAKLEAKTGIPLPMRRGQVLGVLVQSTSSPGAQILKAQGWDDGNFYQRLVVPGAHRLDGEDLLEAVGWLLLNRYAATHTPENQRTGMGAVVPDWVSVGLSQSTQPALRSRNRDWIARERAEGQVLPLAQVVKLAALPPGRWREKAYAAAAVEFLFPEGDSRSWTAFFQAVGTRQAIDATWLRQNCAALRDRNPEEAWRDHLERSVRLRSAEAWSDRGLQVEAQLLQALNFRPRELTAGVPEDVPEELYARDLIEHRGQTWAGPAAAALSLRIQSLELGAPPALREALSSYASYFDLFGTPPAGKTAWWKRARKDPASLRPPDDATWQVALNQLWVRAERAHQAFLESHQSRKRYVDSFDRPVSGDLDDPTPGGSDQPRTRWQKVVDEAEKRLDPPSR